MLKKYMGDPSLIVPTENVGTNDHSLTVPTENVRTKGSLSYVKIRVQIFDHQVRRLRTKEVASVKVIWRNQFVEEATWEDQEDMKKIYPHLFEFRENAYQGTKFSS
ncbi:hypothetical protein EJD97_019932 [Solanum chilense]|uniref:Chromo domain-containing protein n=1 Tax=Solanum chilense TaxID=4083 RepID=A0A6N2AFJ1_SOLCI|nr:hypothetical protein EJD97_019932 [Solanum chilense]